MGLFSSSRVYSVGVSATKLLENNDASLRESVLDAVLNEKDITASILVDKLTGYTTQVQRYYQYGRDSYFYGLPNGTNVSYAFNEGSINTVLQSIHSTDTVNVVDIIFATIDYPIGLYFAQDYLANEMAWDSVTNEVVNHPLTTSETVSLSSATISSAATNQLAITFQYTDTLTSTIMYETRSYTYYETVNTDNRYYHVVYTHDDPPSDRTYWFYDESLGTYPTLDLPSTYVNSNSFLPIGVLRSNWGSVNANPTSQVYLTTKELLNKVSLDVDETIDAIMDTSTNPDANLVRDAFVMFGLGIQENSQAALKYFYEFFTDLDVNLNDFTAVDWSTFVAAGDKSNLPIPVNILNITDSTFNTKLKYNYITTQTFSGSVASVGEYISSTTIISPLVYEIGDVEFIIETSNISFTYQSGANSYTTVTIHGLSHFTDIDGRGTVEWTLETSLTDDSGFYIPLGIHITNKLSKVELEEVYYASLHLVIYAEKAQYVSWYKTPAFLKLVQIVLIVIAIYTGQGQLAAIVSAESFAAGAALVLETLAYAYLTAEALGALVDVVGADNAFLIAVATAAAAIYTGNADLAIAGLPTAQQLMLATTLLSRGITVSVEAELEDIEGDAAEYNAKVAAAYEEIEEINSTLDDTNFSTVTILGWANNIAGGYNTPYSEQTRTINPNPGVLTLSMIESYVDDRLTLKLPDHSTWI